MKHDAHRVSVVVPTINRSSIESCLRSLRVQTRPADEIIVIEDSCRRGASWARNRGIFQSRGDLIAFIDDDCMAPRDWLSGLITAVNGQEVAGAGGTMVDVDPFLRAVRARRTFPALEGVDHQGAVGNTANLMVRREWLMRCLAADGYLFNEGFGIYGSEDHELVLRIRSRGGLMVYVPNPVVHLRRIRPLAYLKYAFNRGIGIAFLHEAHRMFGSRIRQQKSLLWDPAQSPLKRFTLALLHKVIGPTDIDSFPCAPYFIAFWLSRKYEAAGYLFGRLFLTRKIRRIYRGRLQ